MTRRRPIRDLDKNAQANSDSAPEDSPDLQVAVPTAPVAKSLFTADLRAGFSPRPA